MSLISSAQRRRRERELCETVLVSPLLLLCVRRRRAAAELSRLSDARGGELFAPFSCPFGVRTERWQEMEVGVNCIAWLASDTL